MSEPKLKACPCGKPADADCGTARCSDVSCVFHEKVSHLYWQNIPRPSEAAARIAAEICSLLGIGHQENTPVENWRLREWRTQLESLSSPQPGTLVRADVPMCPECGAEMRWERATGNPNHTHRGFCPQCERVTPHPDWGLYIPDLGAVREVKKELRNLSWDVNENGLETLDLSYFVEWLDQTADKLDAALKGGE